MQNFTLMADGVTLQQGAEYFYVILFMKIIYKEIDGNEKEFKKNRNIKNVTRKLIMFTTPFIFALFFDQLSCQPFWMCCLASK